MNAIATIEQAAEVNPLRIFTSAPLGRDTGVIVVEHDGVLLKAGEVAVYDRYPLQTGEGIIHDGLYAIEYQNPNGGMTWESWWDIGKQYGRSRINISREVVIVRRHSKLADHWTIHPIARRDRHGFTLMSDGPIPEHILYDKIIGRIVGIYNPAALRG